MKKPKIQTKSYFNYSECKEYISIKYFEGKDLGDFSSKFSRKDDKFDLLDVPFQCFWHFCIDVCEAANDTPWYLPTEDISIPQEYSWVKPIVAAFINEFGEGPYIHSW